MIRYNKLFALLNSRGMKKTDLLEVISSPTLAKLSKGDVVKMDVIEKICMFLDCQPGDIMEYINEEEVKKKAQEMDEMQKNAIGELLAQGYTPEQLNDLAMKAMQAYIAAAMAGENPISEMVEKSLESGQNIDENK